MSRRMRTVIDALRIELQKDSLKFASCIEKLDAFQQNLHHKAPEIRDTPENFNSLADLLQSEIPGHKECEAIFCGDAGDADPVAIPTSTTCTIPTSATSETSERSTASTTPTSTTPETSETSTTSSTSTPLVNKDI